MCNDAERAHRCQGYRINIPLLRKDTPKNVTVPNNTLCVSPTNATQGKNGL